MELVTLRSDADFVNSIVPAGYLLVFAALDDNGDVIKRYKDSSGNFGTISASSASSGGISDEQAEEIISNVVKAAEGDVETIKAVLVNISTTSDVLDSIIGE